MLCLSSIIILHCLPAQVRRRLLYDLNSSGKYYAFKEQLKRAVIKVVREKYLKTSAITDPVERQSFLSNLYVFLADHMHQRYYDDETRKSIRLLHLPFSLKASFSFNNAEEPPPIGLDIEQLRGFATEAEERDNVEAAAKYHQV